jgi:hypothetical protein
MRRRQEQASSIAAGQQIRFFIIPTLPDWPNGMDDVLSRQLVATGKTSFPGRTAAQCPALVEKFWSGSVVDRSIYSSAAEQRRISRIDDGIHSQLGDISPYQDNT